MKIPISSINFTDRQRLSLGDLNDLSSMSDPDIKQILPVVVHCTLSGYELVDGRRRIAKAQELGWTEIEAFEQDQLTPVQKQKMELLADVARLDRTWQDTAIAYNKIYNMERRERKASGESWTVREMAKFLNISKSNVGRFLLLGEDLTKTPRDEELWSCTGMVEAYKLLLSRQAKEVQKDLERRRQQAVIPYYEAPATGTVTISEEGPFDTPESSVPLWDMTTPAKEEPLEILIHGYNKAFEDAVPDVDFGVGTAHAVIALYSTPQMIKNIKIALRPNCCAVLWEPDSFENLTPRLTFPLIWNKIRTAESNWPFCCNYYCGYVLLDFEYKSSVVTEPASATISAFPLEDENELPPEVVDYTLSAICPPNMAVLCPCNAPVVAVAQTGRIPIWFEADKERFEKKCAELREYYERTIPGVVVKMRGT